MSTLMTVAKRVSAPEERVSEIMNERIDGIETDSSAVRISSEMVEPASTVSLRHSYHELGHIPGERLGRHVVEMDVLEQLKTNMTQLEDLHGRLKFMMQEISYLIVRP